MIWKKTLIIAMLAIGAQAYGQFSVIGGPSVLRPFGAQKTFVGLHIGGEFSQDDATSFFGRITHFAGQTDTTRQAVDLVSFNSSTPYANTGYTLKTNYTVISGGARYYIGDGFESGLSAYGGQTFSLVLNTVKAEYEAYDETKYGLPDGFATKGNVFGFGFGLHGGVKYGISDFATVYFDIGMDYMILTQYSNATAFSSRYVAPFIFNFNLGFRKDIGGDW